MGKPFEIGMQFEVATEPDDIWQAIATGPGIDSWFMGRNEIDARSGGSVRNTFGEHSQESEVTSCEPGRRLAHRSPTGDDGRFIAYEFLIEARDGASTTLRIVTSGFLPGDDWEDEYEAMQRGLELFFNTLAERVEHFAGRSGVPIAAFGPPVDDWPTAWARLYETLGLSGIPQRGDEVRITPPDSTPASGVVYFENADTIGIRTPDALYRFLKGFRGPMIASHDEFGAEVAPAAAWQEWIESALAQNETRGGAQ